jgi:hypothetical protein
MIRTFADFLKSALSEKYDLLNVGIDDKPLYVNMATFLMTGQLLQRANAMGINRDLDIVRGYIGFQDEDVKKYVFFLLFVMNLPLCTNEIWNPKTADYHALLIQKE